MNITGRKLRGSLDKSWSFDQQQALVKEVRRQIGPIADKFPIFCTDALILMYLRAKNLNTKRASKKMKETLKWRLEYKPQNIRWEEIASEAETGKVYKANYLDKYERSVLIMRPGFQNTMSSGGQIRYFIYCMENAIIHSKPGKDQMVWLVDFQKWNMSSTSVKVTKETANVLQKRYPERLGLAILYNPPKVFESFWLMVKPFLQPKTYRKVKFVYSNDPQSLKIMEDLFEPDSLESTFGGKSGSGFDFEAYAKRMKEEEKKMVDMMNAAESAPSSSNQGSVLPELRKSESSVSKPVSEFEEDNGSSSNDENSSCLEGIDEESENFVGECNDSVNLEVETEKKLKMTVQA